MKIRLQTKTTLTIALLVILVLTASSFLFYDTAKRALDAEMGERLVAVAKTSATQLNGSYLRALQPGDEGTRLYRTLQKKLQSMRDASEAQAMYVLDLEYKSLVDSRLDVPIGSQYHSLGEDRIHIDQAKLGGRSCLGRLSRQRRRLLSIGVCTYPRRTRGYRRHPRRGRECAVPRKPWQDEP